MGERTPLPVSGYGVSHAGRVREANEDRYLVAPEIGLFAVFDGMGGHNAGDVAASLARDVVGEYVRSRRRSRRPRRQLLERALQRASAAVFHEAQRRTDRHGMGTTAVAGYVAGDRSAVVAHVGDSRGYLLRRGRIQLLTRDHTVVGDLVAAGNLTAESAAHHPYRSVLSRNLGARPKARVDACELALEEGDRLLLCSDGLTGFAPIESIVEILSDSDDPERAAGDLVEVALRCGGGDNVTAVVIEAGDRVSARTSVEVRSSRATAWWSRRALFEASAQHRGLASSPVCAALPADEAIAVVAGNLAEAMCRDLERAGADHVWSFADTLARGWQEQGGRYAEVRDVLDLLRAAAGDVVADVYASGEARGASLEAELYRTFTAAEIAVGGVVAERLRAVEAAALDDPVAFDESATHEHPVAFDESVTVEHPAGFEDSGERTVDLDAVSEHATSPGASASRTEPPTPEVVRCLEQALRAVRGRFGVAEAVPGPREILARTHDIAAAEAPEDDYPAAAREVYGARPLDEPSAASVFDDLDRAREAYVGAIASARAEPEVRAAAVRRAIAAYRGLASAIASQMVEAARPIAHELRVVAEHTAALRVQVTKSEQRLDKLEDAIAALTGQTVETVMEVPER